MFTRPAILYHMRKGHRQQAVDIVLAGGMGRRAQGLFAESGIEVVVGARTEDPETIIKEYLNGELATGTPTGI